MAQILHPCPPNSFTFNSTLCACNPGYLMNPSRNACTLFNVSADEFTLQSGVTYSPFFLETFFDFDVIKRFTQSQAVFLEATAVALFCWFAFCLAVRFGRLEGGRSVWFQIRWWISRLDFCYATSHWLDDRKAVMKRKTELGGAFSVATLILFLGLFAALLYQIIAKRTVEVHKIRPTNAPDLSSFINDMEFNITTISSMSCSHLRGLGTLTSGTPGFVDFRVFPLSSFASYHCQNTTRGPTIVLKCSSCQVPWDNYYISWQFVDLPNDPATAVGFQFNLTAKKHGDNKHVSYVSGTLKSRSNTDNRPNTFRGADVNVLKFHLFPRIYHNLHNLSLIQPLFREFLPGSSFFETSKLKASLQSSKDGLINITLDVNFLSDYIVEVENENALGLGGVAQQSGTHWFVGSFPWQWASLQMLVACMSLVLPFSCTAYCKIKKLRNEDNLLRNVRSRRRAQLRWDKLRKYVMYTWGVDKLDKSFSGKDLSWGSTTSKSFPRIGSLHKRRERSRRDSIDFDKSIGSNIKTNTVPGAIEAELVRTHLPQDTTHPERNLPNSEVAHVLKHEVPNNEREGRGQLPNDNRHLLPPLPEFSINGGANISDIQRNIKDIYDYNVCLRERFITMQSMLEGLLWKTETPNETRSAEHRST